MVRFAGGEGLLPFLLLDSLTPLPLTLPLRVACLRVVTIVVATAHSQHSHLHQVATNTHLSSSLTLFQKKMRFTSLVSEYAKTPQDSWPTLQDSFLDDKWQVAVAMNLWENAKQVCFVVVTSKPHERSLDMDRQGREQLSQRTLKALCVSSRRLFSK